MCRGLIKYVVFGELIVGQYDWSIGCVCCVCVVVGVRMASTKAGS